MSKNGNVSRRSEQMDWRRAQRAKASPYTKQEEWMHERLESWADTLLSQSEETGT